MLSPVRRGVELSASNLPAFCPNPAMLPWASHPRIFLDVADESQAMCPYCGTHYSLKRNTRVVDHQFDTPHLHQHLAQYAAPSVASALTHTRSRETSDLAPTRSATRHSG